MLKIYDYSTEPNVFNFRKSNLVHIQPLTLKNNGNIAWKKGFKFKCIREKSNLIGIDIEFEKDINPGNELKVELVFDTYIESDQKEFFASYKLMDDKNNQIGTIHKFKIIVS